MASQAAVPSALMLPSCSADLRLPNSVEGSSAPGTSEQYVPLSSSYCCVTMANCECVHISLRIIFGEVLHQLKF